MRELCSSLRLALETRERVGTSGLLRTDQFDRNRAAQHAMLATKDFTHAARSDALAENVLPQLAGRSFTPRDGFVAIRAEPDDESCKREETPFESEYDWCDGSRKQAGRKSPNIRTDSRQREQQHCNGCASRRVGNQNAVCDHQENREACHPECDIDGRPSVYIIQRRVIKDVERDHECRADNEDERLVYTQPAEWLRPRRPKQCCTDHEQDSKDRIEVGRPRRKRRSNGPRAHDRRNSSENRAAAVIDGAHPRDCAKSALER